ncbi:MAG TPA: hypothetical protein VEA59_02660 [Patescibacteria group bacterium]|nr:hypothetical protein [Patescibacteria group bacterium]
MENLKPFLRENQEALEVTVDRKLVSWARRVSRGRMKMLDAYARTKKDFVPCEECCKPLHVGDTALLLKFNKKGMGDRVFCSVDCQRKNYFETLANWRMARKG